MGVSSAGENEKQLNTAYWQMNEKGGQGFYVLYVSGLCDRVTSARDLQVFTASLMKRMKSWQSHTRDAGEKPWGMCRGKWSPGANLS